MGLSDRVVEVDWCPEHGYNCVMPRVCSLTQDGFGPRRMVAVADLLSDDAIDRLRRRANTQSWDVMGYSLNRVRDLLRAALGEL